MCYDECGLRICRFERLLMNIFLILSTIGVALSSLKAADQEATNITPLRTTATAAAASIIEDAKFTTGTNASSTIELPDGGAFIETLYSISHSLLLEKINSSNIGALMNCMAFEADNLGTGDCCFTAFVNLLLLNDLKPSNNPANSKRAKEILSQLAFLTIIFNEEVKFPILKERSRIKAEDIKLIRELVIQSMVEYFNGSVVVNSSLVAKFDKGKIFYTGSENPSKKIIQIAQRHFPVYLVKRSIQGNRYHFRFIHISGESREALVSCTEGVSAKMQINGAEFQSQLASEDHEPSLVILTNTIDDQCCADAFSDLQPLSQGGREQDTTAERMENHVLVTDLSTLFKRNVYYASKKGLTCIEGFAGQFWQSMESIKRRYDSNYSKLPPHFVTDKKKHKQTTAFCLTHTLQ